MQYDQKPIVGAIILAGAMIAGAIILRGSSLATIPVGENALNSAPQLRTVSKNEHILGNPNAKIFVVEYSDLECPYCKVFHTTMRKVVEESNGEIAWVFRHYPIPGLHSKAVREAQATECAWEQGGNDAFWKYTNRIFEITPANNGLPESELSQTAEYTGLDLTAFSECLESGKFAEKVVEDIVSGDHAGVNGRTPSSFILKKGKLVDTIPGALPYEAVMQKLEAVK